VTITRPGVRASARAKPLAPDERRAALIAATLPLVLTQGRQVTTREIAAASGVAEGTIFRVFPDKDSLIDAVVASALDPAPLLAELGDVDLNLPLRDRLVAVTAIVQRRLIAVFDLVTKVGMNRPPGATDQRRTVNESIQKDIIRLLQPDRTAFRMPLNEVTQLLRFLTFSGSHPLISEGSLLTPDQIVGVLLDGVLKRGQT
jgi:AcrR family transcriptional regulator